MLVYRLKSMLGLTHEQNPLQVLAQDREKDFLHRKMKTYRKKLNKTSEIICLKYKQTFLEK
jgi:hypothetical protein